jgi:sulfide:quinone oxidoreductase
MNSVNVLIIGGGSGGLNVANRLKELLGDRAKVTVIDMEKKFTMGLSLLRLMLGAKEVEEITVSKDKITEKGIDFVNAEVQNIDLENMVVKTTNGELSYHYLIIAVGAELAPEKIEGLRDSAYHMYTVEDALKLRDALSSFEGGSIRIVVSTTPFKCPAAPYEAAMLLDHYLKLKKVRDKSDIQIFTPELLPLPVAGPDIGNAVVSLLNERAIKFNSNLKLSSIDGKSRTIVFEDGTREKYDLLIAIPPHTSPKVVRESGLTDVSGWIPVDAETMQTRYDRVYAIGDVAAVKLPSGMMLPKAATFAFGQSEVVSNNIASSILGLKVRRWDGFGECFIETGSGKAAYGAGSFFASPKPAINMQKPSIDFHKRKETWADYWLRKLI